ncbi:MAG: type II toxin-antitoxin system Phd/YefM family antitoxin [Clostridiales Family XIII bacterium]|nr:type II toxin-antitoxin system Phd/YefM family antitoxin [Clostridiales Family XIII bacterium]
MEAVAYSHFRNNLKNYFKKVNEDYEPLIVVNKEPQDNVVVISKDTWDSIQETLYVADNKYLSETILLGLEQIKSGKTKVHELIEDYND